MRQRLNFIGRGQWKGEGRQEGKENPSQLRDALPHRGSPSEGSKQMQTT